MGPSGGNSGQIYLTASFPRAWADVGSIMKEPQIGSDTDLPYALFQGSKGV